MAHMAQRTAGHDRKGAELHPAALASGVLARLGAEALLGIVVLDGSAADLELATRLGNRVGRYSRASVTLVECARTHPWKPLLPAVEAGSIDPGECEVNHLAVQAAERILPGLRECVSAAMHRLLQQVGVAVRTSARVMEVTAESPSLADSSLVALELVELAGGRQRPGAVVTTRRSEDQLHHLVRR